MMVASSKIYILKMFFGLGLLVRIFNDVDEKFFFFVIFFQKFCLSIFFIQWQMDCKRIKFYSNFVLVFLMNFFLLR